MLKTWMKAIEKRAAATEAGGEPFGACLLPDPNGGPPICVQLDQDTCKNLGGRFLGGDCFPNSAVEGSTVPRKSKGKKKKPVKNQE